MPRLTSARYIPYLIATLLSVLCSIWISSRETVVNSDAICYLQSAAAMKEGIQFAMNMCGQAKWPFYSLLIAGFATVTHLSYVTAAYTLDGFFSVLTVFSFMKIVAFLTEKIRSEKNKSLFLLLGAAVILLAHEFNAVKTYIIRDHGFWAFYLISILFLLHYFREKKYYYALAWSVSSLLATLFRVEGAIFLVVIPWIAWFEFSQNKIARVRAFLALNSFTVIVGILLGGWFLLYHPLMTGRLSELQFQLLHGMMLLKQNFQVKALGLAQTVLGENGARDATPVLFITFFVWYFFNVIVNLSLIYSVLVCYAWSKKLLVINQITRFILWSYIGVNVFITAIFLGQNMFLSKRYLIALSLVLMLWVPFALYSLIQQWQQRKWPLLLAIVFIFISSLGGLFDFGYSKEYVRDAGQWLSEHVPNRARLYSNDLQLMYYSNHFGNQIFTQFQAYMNLHTLVNGRWKKYDYLALHVDQKELSSPTSILHEIKVAPIQIFHNKRGDQVRIYRGNFH